MTDATPFRLHPRLAADTRLIGDLPLSRLLLLNDARYPWVILVPRRVDVREIHELADVDRVQLLVESCAVAEFLQAEYAPHKLNIGALGNLVPQLHLHHVGRNIDDPAWPGPVWGHSPAQRYGAEAAARELGRWRGFLDRYEQGGLRSL